MGSYRKLKLLIVSSAIATFCIFNPFSTLLTAETVMVQNHGFPLFLFGDAVGTRLASPVKLTLLPQPAIAQPDRLRRVDPVAIATQLYQQLPDIPLENQYLSRETGSAATDNTLISRFIRYHIYTRNRPTNFRLDWKLTLADYLGAFETISAEKYPQYGLQENPMAGDVAAIESLDRDLRDRLIDAIYQAFTPSQSPETSMPTSAPTSATDPAPDPVPSASSGSDLSTSESVLTDLAIP